MQSIRKSCRQLNILWAEEREGRVERVSGREGERALWKGIEFSSRTTWYERGKDREKIVKGNWTLFAIHLPRYSGAYDSLCLHRVRLCCVMPARRHLNAQRFDADIFTVDKPLDKLSLVSWKLFSIAVFWYMFWYFFRTLCKLVLEKYMYSVYPVFTLFFFPVMCTMNIFYAPPSAIF